MYAKVVTLWRLGLINLVWVAAYRTAVKLGLVTKNMLPGSPIKGPFFLTDESLEKDESLESLDQKIFGWGEYSKERVPNWNEAFLSGKQTDLNCHWSKISDFDLDIGDIKNVWEISRFDWVSFFVVEYIKNKDRVYIDRLNEWIEDWSSHNPNNLGINWKCGQEASFSCSQFMLSFFLFEATRLTHSRSYTNDRAAYSTDFSDRTLCNGTR